jgi:hypothetical protein
MATIDIFSLEPSVISRDLKGKYIAIYGREKVGKTTFGARLPRALFCNFEVGTNFISGVKAQNIAKWSDFKLVLRQLEMPKAHDYYDTVVIDTIGQAYTLCEEYICAQAGVQKLGDIPYGAGYASCKKEFEGALRKITMGGFGICCICHSEVKKEAGPNDTVVEVVSPAMPSRAADVVNRLVDIIAYIDVFYDENGNAIRQFVTRRTPTIMAGNRLPYLDPIIPFSYDSLVDAIGRAIDKQQEMDGAQVVDTTVSTVTDKLDYNAIRTEAAQLWAKLTTNADGSADEEMARRVQKRIEMVFGRVIKLSEITEDQVDLFNLVLLDMRELAAEK